MNPILSLNMSVERSQALDVASALCGAAVGAAKLGSQTKFGVVGRNCLSVCILDASFSAHSQFKVATRTHPAGDSPFLGYFLWRRKESNLLSGNPRYASFPDFLKTKWGQVQRFLRGYATQKLNLIPFCFCTVLSVPHRPIQ